MSLRGRGIGCVGGEGQCVFLRLVASVVVGLAVVSGCFECSVGLVVRSWVRCVEVLLGWVRACWQCWCCVLLRC